MDLTEQLKQAKTKFDERVKASADAAAIIKAASDVNVPPTQGEARRWLRSGRYSRKVSLFAT